MLNITENLFTNKFYQDYFNKTKYVILHILDIIINTKITRSEQKNCFRKIIDLLENISQWGIKRNNSENTIEYIYKYIYLGGKVKYHGKLDKEAITYNLLTYFLEEPSDISEIDSKLEIEFQWAKHLEIITLYLGNYNFYVPPFLIQFIKDLIEDHISQIK